MTEIKIQYRTVTGVMSKAYVDTATFSGVDKWTDEPVAVYWVNGEYREKGRMTDLSEKAVFINAGFRWVERE